MAMSLKTALRMISAAQNKSEEIGVPMCVAVVDGGGNLIAQHCMDGAMLISQTLSLNKAYTSVATTMATGELAKYSQPGQPFYGVHTCNFGRITIFAGGLPVLDKGGIVGGIGVSGGSSEQDLAVADAGRNAFGN
ncbi:MAG: heme-binding protein [Geobacteraceae bacterium]|nr:heme-binding protein [Geobacteraceae bacterium]